MALLQWIIGGIAASSLGVGAIVSDWRRIFGWLCRDQRRDVTVTVTMRSSRFAMLVTVRTVGQKVSEIDDAAS